MSLAPPDPRLHDAYTDEDVVVTRHVTPWKFTHAQRARMVSDYVEGVEPLAVIAKRYGCSKPWPLILAKRAGYPLRTKRERG